MLVIFSLIFIIIYIYFTISTRLDESTTIFGLGESGGMLLFSTVSAVLFLVSYL